MTSTAATTHHSEPSPFEAASAEAFAERTGQRLDSAAVVLMMGIGHRLGLFATMAELPPATSPQIAERSQLAERYVREWLAVMVTGGVVQYDASRRHYWLPPEHAACLTPGAPLGNLAVYAQLIAMAGAVHEPLLECFRSGAGLDYATYPHFHSIMAEDSGQTVVAQLFETLSQLVPQQLIRLERGIDVLDAGCGSGRALIELARRFPKSRFRGVDFCADAIDSAQKSAAAAGVSNVRFDEVDLSQFSERERYDLITSFDAVHDTKDPQQLLQALYRALRASGVHLMQDIAGSSQLENNLNMPFAPLLYAISCVHCTPVSLAQDGLGLGTMWGWETAERMLEAAGYSRVERHLLPHDPMNVWFVSHKQAS